VTEPSDAASALRQLWATLADREWDAIAELLDPAVEVRYVHTGEVLDRAGFVAANRNYPGRWRVTVQDVVADGDKAVTLTRLDNGTETMYVASFATTRRGLITSLIEVWADAEQPVHASRTAGQPSSLD
jgi:hypothetical protein